MEFPLGYVRRPAVSAPRSRYDVTERLRLFKSRERLEALLQEATGKEISYADFLDCVLAEEVVSKAAKNVTNPPGVFPWTSAWVRLM